MLFPDSKIASLPNYAFIGKDLVLAWLSDATPSEQEQALFEWFTLRYEDPVHSLPYISREGGYQFIYGDPIDPAEELEQFCEYTSAEVIENVTRRLYDISYEWSPIPDYDDYYHHKEINKPIDDFHKRICSALLLLNFSENARIIDIKSLLSEAKHYEGYSEYFLRHQLENKLNTPPNNEILYLQRLSVFSLLIIAFETYLWEVTRVNLDALKLELRKNLINSLKSFKDKKKLCDIYSEGFDFHKELDSELNGNIIWHNVDNINAIFKGGFKLDRVPDFNNVSSLLKKRHDIVHRFGLDREGHAIELSNDDIHNASNVLKEYCEELDFLINEKIASL